MKRILSPTRERYLAKFSIFLITVALIAGVAACGPAEEEEEQPPQKIQTWYNLDAIRNNLGGKYVLMNDLDSAANSGSGWQPIGTPTNPFTGTFDGQGYKIRGLFINRPDEDNVGLFGFILEPAVIENVGLLGVNVTGRKSVGALVGYSWKGTLDSDTGPRYSKTYSTGSVTGKEDVGGLVGNNYGGIVNQCESSADVFHVSSAPDKKREHAGGLVGLNGGDVSHCDYNGVVNGDREVGGLVGHNALLPQGLVQFCGGVYSVHGNSGVGGVVGVNLGEIHWASFRGEVNGIPGAEYLIALNEGATRNADSPDTALPGWYVGGVAGDNQGTMENCNATATVEGYRYVGGFAGANSGNVTGCSCSGYVTGSDDVGRFVGYNRGTLSDPESTSCVTGTSDCGPLVGTNVGEIISGISIPLKNPGNFVQMTIGDIDSLDPAWGYDTASGEQVSYIYETLIFYDGTKSNEFVPVLATEWNLSADKRTYRFKIRKGVKFQEGGDLTPSDVEYSFERAMVQDRDGGPMWLIFEPLLGVDSSSDTTFAAISHAVEVDGDWVVFHLSDPSWANPFLQILCGTWASIVDKEWCIAKGDWPGTEATWQNPKWHNPTPGTSVLHKIANGTGPWKLNLWDLGVQIKLEKNANYWRGSVPFDRVITQVVDEWTTRKLALLAGDADFVYVPRMYIGELEGIADLNVYKDLPTLQIDSFFFNFNIASTSAYIGSGKLDGNGIPTDFFSDIDVRKGFNCAFDWTTYIHEVMMDEAKQMASPVIEGLSYYNSATPKYSLDLTKAAEYLKKAWGGQVWEKGFKFTLIYNAGNVPRKMACTILAENLAKVNSKFQVSVLPVQWSGTLKMIVTRTMPMFQIGWMADFPDPDNFVTPFMSSGGTFSKYQSYNNTHVDELIETGRLSTNPTQRQAIYYELQQIYYNDAPGIMLVQPMGRRFFTKYIHGFYFNPMIPGLPGPLYYMSKSSS